MHRCLGQTVKKESPEEEGEGSCCERSGVKSVLLTDKSGRWVF